MAKKILIIYGPSGAGKTVSGSLLESWGIPRVLTNTTREPKNGEINGVHYNFVGRSEFPELDLVEFTEYDNNYYGISKEGLHKSWNKSDLVVAVTDINGVLAFKEKFPEQTITLYVVAPAGALEERMLKRGDRQSTVADRIANIEKSGEFSNLHLADHVIVNKDWKTTVAMLNVIMQAAQGSLKEYSA